ncbi:MAG: ABC transporter permease [Rickettsiales bacterium]
MADEKLTLMINTTTVRALCKRETLRYLGYWQDALIEPAISMLVFLAIFSLSIAPNMHPVGGLTYEQFIVPGLIMMTVITNAFDNNGFSIMIAKMEGTMIDILMPPFRPLEVVFGMAFGGVSRGFIVAAVVAVALYCFVPLTLYSLPLALLYLFLGALWIALIGTLVGIMTDTFDQLMAYNFYAIVPLSYLSGSFFPVSTLPPFWVMLNQFNPFYYLIDGFRYAMTGYHEASLTIGLIYLTTLNIGFFVLAMRVFKTGWRMKS